MIRPFVFLSNGSVSCSSLRCCALGVFRFALRGLILLSPAANASMRLRCISFCPSRTNSSKPRSKYSVFVRDTVSCDLLRRCAPGSSAIQLWRRGGDSNPRDPCRSTRFPSGRTRPLCDLSFFRKASPLYKCEPAEKS
jgi:hypothetical protein